VKAGLQPWTAFSMFRAGAITLLAILALAMACGGADEDELLVFAAASLTDVLTELGDEYRAETGIDVVFSFGGSQLLARQIVNGAPADLLISAGEQPVQMLVRQDLVSGRPFDLVGNELVVVARNGLADAHLELEDLATSAFASVSIPDPDLAPAGTYAREALTSLGLWDALADKIVPAPDVRAALTNVERGNTDAAVVYRTDAATASGLLIFDIIPPGSHSPIIYPAVVTIHSQRPDAARAFAEFLGGDAAGRIFARFGFAPAPDGPAE
jgi:molybdate transport system substrate-binding protein